MAALVLLVVTISPVLIPRLLESPSHADQQKYLLVTAHPVSSRAALGLSDSIY